MGMIPETVAQVGPHLPEIANAASEVARQLPLQELLAMGGNVAEFLASQGGIVNAAGNVLPMAANAAGHVLPVAMEQGGIVIDTAGNILPDIMAAPTQLGESETEQVLGWIPDLLRNVPKGIKWFCGGWIGITVAGYGLLALLPKEVARSSVRSNPEDQEDSTGWYERPPQLGEQKGSAAWTEQESRTVWNGSDYVPQEQYIKEHFTF